MGTHKLESLITYHNHPSKPSVLTAKSVMALISLTTLLPNNQETISNGGLRDLARMVIAQCESV